METETDGEQLLDTNVNNAPNILSGGWQRTSGVGELMRLSVHEVGSFVKCVCAGTETPQNTVLSDAPQVQE